MRVKLLYVGFIFVLAALLTGCSLVSERVSIVGSGSLTTQEEDITGFDKVDVSHAFKVDINRGEAYRVIVRVDDNLVEYLEVVKKGDTLKIGLKLDNSYNIQEATMEAEVTMPELAALELSGASHADITDFKSTKALDADLSGASFLRGDIIAGDARFDISGASRVTLSGSAQDLRVDASGASIVDLGDFPGDDADVEASGASTVTVFSNGKLDVQASGASHVYYFGQPTLGKQETSGSSSIHGE